MDTNWVASAFRRHVSAKGKSVAELAKELQPRTMLKAHELEQFMQRVLDGRFYGGDEEYEGLQLLRHIGFNVEEVLKDPDYTDLTLAGQSCG